MHIAYESHQSQNTAWGKGMDGTGGSCSQQIWEIKWELKVLWSLLLQESDSVW